MKTKEYTVKWEMQILSTNKEDAARQALQIMRDKKSTATVMNVVEFDNTADEPEEFAESIVKIITDKQLSNKLSNNCKDLIQKNYSVNSLMDEANEIINYLTVNND